MTTPYAQAQSLVGALDGPRRELLTRYMYGDRAGLTAGQRAWCADFVNASLRQAGVPGTNSAAARSFLNWGTPTKEPREGDVAVLTRGDPNGWKGHVGFYAGPGSTPGTVRLLGGNQGADRSVNYSEFPRSRVLGFRQPPSLDGEQPDMLAPMAVGAPKPAPGPVTWPAYHPMRPESPVSAAPAFDAGSFWAGHDRYRFADGGAVGKALRIAERQTEHNPSEAQKESGNYKKGRVRLHGFDIAIENAKGSERSGIAKNGKRWSVRMPCIYGDIKRTEGADGDALDVYVGPSPESEKAFIIDQIDAGTKAFDEHKSFLGFNDKAEVLRTYEKAFSDGKAKDRIGCLTEMSVSDFRAWVRTGDTTKAMSSKKNAWHPALALARHYASGGRVGYAEGGELPVDPFAMSPAPEGGNNPIADWWASLDENARATALEYAKKSKWDIGQEAAMEALPVAIAGAFGPAAQGVGRAFPAIGRSASSLAERFPRMTGAAEGMSVVGLVDAASRYLSPASAQGAKANTQGADAEAVKTLQRELKAKGYYTGPIDGRMEGGTAAAKEAFERDKAASERRTLELERARSASTKESAALKAAEAAIAETERKKQEDIQKAANRAAGEQRFKDIEENTHWARKAYRDWAPSLGYVLGAGAGVLSRKGIVNKADALSKKAAGRADDLMEPPRGDLNERVGKVNQFWSEGQPAPWRGGREEPFLPSQGNAAFKPNPAAPTAADLYLPNKTANLGRDLGVAGLYGAESAIAQFGLRNPAYEELERARKAADENPSEININAYQVARDRAAFGELLTNFGRTGAALSLGSGVKYQREGTRPNISAAESERMDILDALKRPSVKPSGTSPSSGPSAPQALTAEAAPAQLAAPPALRLPAPTPEPAALPARTAAGTQSSAAKTSGRPSWAGEPPAEVKLKRGYYWDTATSRPRHKDGTFGDMPKYSAKASKKSKGNKLATDEPGPKISDPNDPAYWSGKLTDGMKNGGALALARKYAGKLKRAFGGRAGYAHGGAIALARQYANGGHVESGPIVGDHGGRADTRPISVPSGAFIVPADVVSGLDEAGGNTQAGFRALERMFGRSEPGAADAGGNPVEIKISDGEFVVSPSVVARIGKGDMEAGHRALDLFVKKVRAEHIKKLAALPPPATS